MEINLKGTHTYDNLMKAFEGEAKAHLKYLFYKSKIANFSKEYEEILEEISHNEKEHGKIWFKFLHNGKIPEDIINLYDAILNETEEHKVMYPEFARIAREEGFNNIAYAFEEVAAIEGKHAEKFSEILNNIQEEKVFKEDKLVYWKCKNCGYVFLGKNPPLECPVCSHPQKYFTRD